MSLVITILLGYGVLCALLFFAQRSMIYIPTPEVAHRAAEDLRFSTGEETIQVWKLSGSEADAILYFGGNAEEVGANLNDFSVIFPGRTIYLVNYRGYGASTGSPSEAGILHDATSIYDRIRRLHHRIIVVGRSLGSGVAMHIGGERDPTRIILITPYDSLKSVAARLYPIFPVSLLLRDRFDSVQYAGSIEVPTLILAAEQDRVIPLEHSKALAEALPDRLLRFLVIDGAGHNTIGEFPDYRRSIAKFALYDDDEV